jgi:hypothetical protein
MEFLIGNFIVIENFEYRSVHDNKHYFNYLKFIKKKRIENKINSQYFQ